MAVFKDPDWSYEDRGDEGQFAMRALIEQLGVESLNPGVNTIFRYEDAYQAGAATLLWFRNGLIQDTTAVDYTETDDRTVTMAAGMLAIDRLLGIVITDNIGSGGLAGVDRPPAGAGAGPYTTTAYVNAFELFVWLNGVLQIDGVAEDYQSDVANNQFTFNAAIPAGSTIVTAIIRLGVQGLITRETFINQGPFPANRALVNAIDEDTEGVLVWVNGQLQSQNHDYIITAANTVRITRVLPGATHSIVVVRMSESLPAKWRA